MQAIKKYIKYLTPVLLFPLFLTTRMDPDMWWHFRLGKQIIETGTFTNNLTYTCSAYIWTNHSWFSDVLIYWIQSHFGIVVLSLFFSLIVFAGVLVNYNTYLYFQHQRKHKGSNKQEGIFIILSYMILMSFLAIRPQIFTFLLLSILLNRLLKIYYSKLQIRDFVIIAFLFLIWVNLHGGFIIGYAVVLFFFFAEIGEFIYKIFVDPENSYMGILKSSLIFLKVLFLTLPLSLVNPFFFGAWKEALNNIFSPQNSTYISEWLAVNLKQQFGLMYFLIFLAGLILFIINKKTNFLLLSLYLIFGFFSLYSIRLILVAVPIVSIVVLSGLYSLTANWHKYLFADDISNQLKRFMGFIPSFFIVLVILIGLTNLVNWGQLMSDVKFTQEYQAATYPYKAVDFLKQHPQYLKLKFFNDYGWGGYLSWVLPDQKWFIDGRMAVWSCDGLVRGSILQDYIELDSVYQGWQSVINEYGIQAFVIKSDSHISSVLRESKDWKKIFEDGNEVIFIKL